MKPLTTSLTICSTAIRQDDAGRYCLNDCHRAAGAVKKDGPSYWLATDAAKKLISHLSRQTTGKPVVTHEGRNGGTFADKELVYAYAMWISPEFMLFVVRAFDDMVSGVAPAPAVPTTFREALLLAADQQAIIDEQRAALLEAEPKAAALDRISEADGELGVRDAGRELGVGQKRLIEEIMRRGWACRQGRHIRPASRGLQYGYVRLIGLIYEDPRTGQERISDEFRLTRKGIVRLAQVFNEAEN